HAENCNLMTHNGSFFDITHTFKVGSSTYHILGLRKDRPTYRNNYYIFNCTDNQHDSIHESLSKSTLFKRSRRVSEQASAPKHRPLTADHTTTTIHHFSSSQSQKTK